jgi:hypothetical protein
LSLLTHGVASPERGTNAGGKVKTDKERSNMGLSLWNLFKVNVVCLFIAYAIPGVRISLDLPLYSEL